MERHLVNAVSKVVVTKLMDKWLNNFSGNKYVALRDHFGFNNRVRWVESFILTEIFQIINESSIWWMASTMTK